MWQSVSTKMLCRAPVVSEMKNNQDGMPMLGRHQLCTTGIRQNDFRCGGPMQIRPIPDSAHPAWARKRSPAFTCSDVMLKTYVTPGLSFLKRLLRVHFYLNLTSTNHIGIPDVLLTEIMLVATQNPCMLLLLSQIRQIRAESGPGRFWDHHTGKHACCLLGCQ